MSITEGTRSTYEDRSSVKDNMDDRLDFLTPTDVPFLSYIGFAQEAGGAFAGANSLKFPCTQERHLWYNDDLIGSTTTLASAYTAADGQITVSDGESEKFRDGDIFMIGDTIFEVTATNHSTDVVTATAHHNDANAANGATVYIFTNAWVEGTAASSITSRTTDFGSTENYTQIFFEVVRLTGTEMSTERWGVSGDPYDYQINKKMKELGIRLERAAIYNRRNSSYPSDNTTARRMGGLAEFVRDASGANVLDANSEDLDEILLNNLLEDIWEDGGMPDTVMVPARQKRMISAFLSPYVRVDRSESTAGVIVGAYESDFGVVTVVMNRWMKPSDLLVLPSGEVGIGPLEGNGNSRAFFSEPLPKDGDYERTQMIGEYTMEARNATKNFGWYEDLSTS